MSKFLKQLHIAVEEIEEQQEAEAAAAQAEVVDEAEVPAEVHEEVEAVVEEAEGAVETTDEIEGAVADTNDLEQIGDVAEATLEGEAGEPGEGEGLTPSEAEVVQVAVESLYRRLGIKKTARIATESFGADRTRKLATEAMVADIKANVKKAWDAIMQFFKKVLEAVKGFFTKVFTATGRVKAQAAKIKELAAAAGDKAGGEISIGGTADKLEVGGKFDGSKVAAEVEAFIGSYNALMHGAVEMADSANRIVGQAGGDLSAQDVKFDSLKKYADKKRGADSVELYGDELPGNKTFAITLPKNDGNLNKFTFGLFAQAKFGLIPFDGKRDFKAPEKVAALSPADAAKVAEATEKLADAIDAQKKTAADIQKVVAATLSTIDKFSKGAGDKAEGQAEVRRGISKIGTVLGSVPSHLTGYALTLAKASLDFAGKSVSAAKKGAKEAAPAAA